MGEAEEHGRSFHGSDCDTISQRRGSEEEVIRGFNELRAEARYATRFRRSWTGSLTLTMPRWLTSTDVVAEVFP